MVVTVVMVDACFKPKAGEWIIGKAVVLSSKTMNTPASSNCDTYWEEADWLPPWFILQCWCQQDERCRQAKQQALLSACDRGEVNYRRSDGKTFDDPIQELSARGILLIERQSFDLWACKVDGKSPLSTLASSQPPQPLPSLPSWSTPTTLTNPQTAATWIAESAPLVIQTPALTEPLTPPCMEPSDGTVVDDATVEVQTQQGDDNAYPPEAELRKRGVPANEIIDAFRVKFNPSENSDWWKDRMGNTKRYKKLLPILVQKGLPSRGEQRFPSWWRPDLMASWLIDEHHMPRHKVVDGLTKKLPAWADSVDYL